MRRIFALLSVMALLAVGVASASATTVTTGEITESVITFENDGGTVYGTFVAPDDVRRRVPAVLMLHGFTGDRNEGPVLQPDFTFTDTMYERTANELAENGIASLRIDFRGSGESLDQFGFEGYDHPLFQSHLFILCQKGVFIHLESQTMTDKADTLRFGAHKIIAVTGIFDKFQG